MGETEPDQQDSQPGPVVAEQRKRTGVSGGFKHGDRVRIADPQYPWLCVAAVSGPGFGKGAVRVFAVLQWRGVMLDVQEDRILGLAEPGYQLDGFEKALTRWKKRRSR